MKILLCTRLFAPENLIGAIRPTNFADNLYHLGHDITVLTSGESSNNTKDARNGYVVYRISKNNFLERLKRKRITNVTLRSNTKNQKTKSSIIAFRRHSFALLQDIFWFWNAYKALPKICKSKDFDIVISSYGPLSSFLLGFCVKRKRYATYWISDMRDMIVSTITPKVYKGIYTMIQNKMLKDSDAITVVSEGQKAILLKQLSHKCKNVDVQVLYNGFNKMPQLQNSLASKSCKLIITYTGGLYSGLRDLSMLFRALLELYRENKIDMRNVEFHYAGDDFEELLLQVEDDSLYKFVQNHGFIDRQKSLELQVCSDILVVLSWNTEQEQGILTGKFLEYLHARKPIIGLVTGDKPNAELTFLINMLNVGISCEYVGKRSALDDLKRYILSQYINKMNTGSVSYNAKEEEINRFDYCNICRELEKICSNLFIVD